ncbi:hypothetical protein ACIHCM_35870 [Streptomyces sp. NPDC052023]|uniref:hypothetical protein n=1 Tax=Streptomyces sp. NPDC052023 TaxID=3365681 RepID=UPI0037D83343
MDAVPIGAPMVVAAQRGDTWAPNSCALNAPCGGFEFVHNPLEAVAKDVTLIEN